TCRNAKAASHTYTVTMVLPDSGPTGVFQFSASLMLVLASARVVATPRARPPMPAARMAAAIGPSGRSGYSMPPASAPDASEGRSVVVLIGVLLVDRCDLGDQGPQRAGDGGEAEREHEQGDGGLADPVMADQVGAVVDDDERHHGGQDRAEPG